MPIGTSLGGFFRTEMDFHIGDRGMDFAEHNETVPSGAVDTLDKNIINSDDLMTNRITNADPHNITDDSGKLVDYDKAGMPALNSDTNVFLRPQDKKFLSASEFNSIDENALKDSILTPNDRVQAGFDALKQ